MNKLQPLSARILCSAALLGSLVVAPSAFAATLSLESVVPATQTMIPPVDLTAEGTLDWAYWRTTSTFSGPVAPTNSKQGGLLISDAFTVGGGRLKGTTSSTAATEGRYSFSDGTAPAEGTNLEMIGLLFNEQLKTEGAGFKLEITGDPGAERFVRLYLGGFGAKGRLELTLAGATTVVDTSQTFGVFTPKDLAIYTVRFQPDLATDLLTVSFTALAPDGPAVFHDSAHVGLEAVTVSNIPEPGSALLLGIGAIALTGTRRRRS